MSIKSINEIFDRCLQRADCVLHYVQEWVVGREHLQLGIAREYGRISMSWRTVVNEENLLVGVKILPRLAKKSFKRGTFIPPI